MKNNQILTSKSAKWVWALLIGLFLLMGCDTAFTVGGRTVGVISGQFIFTDGYLTANYKFPLDMVRKACEKTLVDMKATDMEIKSSISSINFAAVVHDEKISIKIEYASKEQTLVSIKVGMAGNNMASQLIHEKITNNLLKVEESAKS